MSLLFTLASCLFFCSSDWLPCHVVIACVCSILTLSYYLYFKRHTCDYYVNIVLVLNLVFKVIGIEESAFVEKTNLRVGRINLNFSITDVQWHPFEGNKFFSKISLEQGCYEELGQGVPKPLSNRPQQVEIKFSLDM